MLLVELTRISSIYELLNAVVVIMNDYSKKLSYPKIILFFSLLLVIWGLYAFLYHSVIKSSLGDWGIEIVGASIKLLLWSVPAVVLARNYRGDLLLTLREMFTTKVKPIPYVLVFLGFLAINLVSSIVLHGKITIIRPDPIASLLGDVLFVGVTEELLFRGFFLNALLRKTKTVYAHLISSAMFLAIHFPGWIFGGTFTDLLSALAGCASIFAVSIVFGWTFMKSRNIIIPIILHMSWNLMVVLHVA